MFDTNVNKALAELICVLIDNLADHHSHGVTSLNGGWAVSWNNENRPVRMGSPAVKVLPRQAVIWYEGHVVGFISLDLKEIPVGLLLVGDLVAALKQSIQAVVEEGHAE